MRADKARRLFRSLTEQFFQGANVIFSNQSRTAKPPQPLVVITTGPVRQGSAPNYAIVNGEMVGYYESRMSITVDLFTMGTPVTDDETRQIVAYENCSMEDMLAFSHFLNSMHVVDWSHKHDVSIILDSDVLDVTSLLNDSNYSYRSRLSVQFYFTQEAVGYSAVLSEDSIRYPTGDRDPVTGEAVYTPEKPVATTSPTGYFKDEADQKAQDAIILPEYEQSPSGGGSTELADETAGYFTEAEIKEETGNE